jgi:hypothetical protein
LARGTPRALPRLGIHTHEAQRTPAESAQKALADALTEIDQLAAELNKTQALDPRWAIGGLFISVSGTALQDWA